jgi:mRNA interferase MazF
MKRGEVWTVAGGTDYAGKPRPVVILQDDAYDVTRSVTICPLTTTDIDLPATRPVIVPSGENGLRNMSRLMADKVTTVARTKLHARVGRLSAQDVMLMNRAVIVFLGLGGTARR